MTDKLLQAAQAALTQKPRTKAAEARLERLDHANELIRVISDHGRRFFWNYANKRVARLELDGRSKVWWIDDYRGSRVCTEKICGYEHSWRGFSHGGTLMQLVQMMRDYIKTGERIPLAYICMQRRMDTDGDIWGYGAEAAAACREAAAKLPIIAS